MHDPIRKLLESIGEDPDRNGLLRTPERWSAAMKELLSGYGQTAEDVVGEGIFSSASNDPVIINGIDFSSVCEHHMLPFFGKIDIAYIPNKRILGLSKIPKIIDVFSHRLQIQEHLGHDICKAMFDILKPKGICVIVEAVHLCMKLRGVKSSTLIVTQHQKGELGENALRSLR